MKASPVQYLCNTISNNFFEILSILLKIHNQIIPGIGSEDLREGEEFSPKLRENVK